jgi:hypothetical protein
VKTFVKMNAAMWPTCAQRGHTLTETGPRRAFTLAPGLPHTGHGPARTVARARVATRLATTTAGRRTAGGETTRAVDADAGSGTGRHSASITGPESACEDFEEGLAIHVRLRASDSGWDH